MVLGLLSIFLTLALAQSSNEECKADGSCTIPAHLKLVLPDVHLDPKSIFQDERVWKARLGQQSPQQNIDLGQAIMWAQKHLPPLINQPKSAALKTLADGFKDFIVKNQTGLPEGYLFYGPDSLQNLGEDTLADIRATLGLFLKTNAFYVNTISVDKDGGLQILSSGDNSFFSKIISAISSQYHRVDLKLNSNFEITSYSVYELKDGQRTEVQATELEAIEKLLILLNYYSECIHTNLHTFQYLLGSSLAHASDVSVATLAFSHPYLINSQTTYSNVVKLDLQEGATLVGGVFKADRDQILSILREMLAMWGHFKSAQDFIDNFIFANFQDKSLPSKFGMLEEFQKHANFLKPFAYDVTKYMDRNPRYRLSTVNKRLETFLDNTGTGLFKISKLSTWLELISVTSLVHAQTLSFTRLMMTKVSLTAISPSDKFEMFDVQYWRATAPTIVGSQSGRYLFHSTTFEKETPYYDPELMTILAKYAAHSDELKQKYLQKVTDEGSLSKVGWIVADFFPEQWDGRQITLNTYL